MGRRKGRRERNSAWVAGVSYLKVKETVAVEK